MYDLLVIGGGINGAGIARDAAGRGLRVLLCERDDLGQHTSSASSKLIHGGLRYLENYEFRLVRAALKEREVLLKAAPHIIWPLRFILPHNSSMRPAWFLRLGLFIYDHLGGQRSLPGTKTVPMTSGQYAGTLNPSFVRGFEYSDCWVEDARLVVLNAMDARDHGADIRTQTSVVGLNREGKHWRAELRGPNGAMETVLASGVVNAAGAWVDDILNLSDRETPAQNLRLVKGSHIVVDQLYDHNHAFTFQVDDGRVVFTIPYEGEYTLIGTTDENYDPADGPPEICDHETRYLCDVVNSYFEEQISPQDVVWSYSGVRPLFDDNSDNASVVTRDFVFDLDAPGNEPPILSIFGGKITTFRELAEKAVDKLAAHIKVPKPEHWTHIAPLPGGELIGDFDDYVNWLSQEYPWLPGSTAHRLARAYGTRTELILKNAKSIDDLGRSFGAGLTEAEVIYLRDHEFVRDADDILWRRSKLGLHMAPDKYREFADWFVQLSSQQSVKTA